MIDRFGFIHWLLGRSMALGIFCLDTNHYLFLSACSFSTTLISFSEAYFEFNRWFDLETLRKKKAKILSYLCSNLSMIESWETLHLVQISNAWNCIMSKIPWIPFFVRKPPITCKSFINTKSPISNSFIKIVKYRVYQLWCYKKREYINYDTLSLCLLSNKNSLSMKNVWKHGKTLNL